MQGMLSTLSQVQHYAGNVVYTVTGTLVQHTDDSVQVVGNFVQCFCKDNKAFMYIIAQTNDKKFHI